MSDQDTLSKKPAPDVEEPVAALYSPDLMFMIRLQGMARAAGYEPLAIRNSGELGRAKVLVVNLAGSGGWEPIITEAAREGLPVVAFGPHLDAESRRLARKVGAMRVLANSNLERDLPRILRDLASRETEES